MQDEYLKENPEHLCGRETDIVFVPRFISFIMFCFSLLEWVVVEEWLKTASVLESDLES